MMQKRPTSVLVLDSDLSELRLLVERYAGVLLEQPCESLRTIVSECSQKQQLNSGAELVALLRSAPARCDDLLEVLLAGESGFFRHPRAFEVLQNDVLPEIVCRKSSKNPGSIRMWSAGCGSGEEAYSIAMLVCESLNCGTCNWNIHIVASDIRQGALRAAERGLYTESKLEKIPRSLISSYFSRVGDHFLVKPRLRNLITFSPMNLMERNFFGHFDCIFCMDVLAHFSAGQRGALLQRLGMLLEPGGCLFLGDEEKIGGNVGLECATSVRAACYRRPLAAAAASGR
jgi:two-component system, chemotaxis family, CheB/CheR fusion protein